MIKRYTVAILTLLLSFGPGLAEGQATQLNGPPASVSLTMTISESITVSVTPTAITFTNAGTTATASGPISVVTSWNVAAGRTAIDTVASLTSITAALTGPTVIPASSVFASINNGTATACTLASINSVVGVGVSGALCPDVFHTTPSAGSGSHTDTILLSLSGLAAPLPSGTWTGTLNITPVLI